MVKLSMYIFDMYIHMYNVYIHMYLCVMATLVSPVVPGLITAQISIINDSEIIIEWSSSSNVGGDIVRYIVNVREYSSDGDGKVKTSSVASYPKLLPGTQRELTVKSLSKTAALVSYSCVLLWSTLSAVLLWSTLDVVLLWSTLSAVLLWSILDVVLLWSTLSAVLLWSTLSAVLLCSDQGAI